MKIRTLLSLTLIWLMIAGCSSTKLSRSWADPAFNATTMKPFTKILVIAPLKDVNSQRITEDKIIAALKQGVGVQSYKYLQPSDTLKSALESKLKIDGFDGIITMSLKDVEKSTSYVQGTSTYGGGWYGYGGYGYHGYYGGGYAPGYYSEGYYKEDKTFTVETNLFSLSEKKLLWSGTTSTLNPSSLDKTLDQIIAAIKSELQKKGYINK
jgi:hypothetical protein